MAISFPLSAANLFDLLKIESSSWEDYRQEESSGLGTGEFLTADLAPLLFQAVLRTAAMPHVQAEQLMARARSLDGSNNHFYVGHPRMKFPQSDPTGSIVGSNSVTIHTINANRKAIRLTGLPAGYVITLGDWQHADYGSPTRRAIWQAMETVTADGSGLTPQFEVRPHLRPGITTTLAVSVKNPAAKMKIVPGSAQIEQVDIVNSRIAFTARQTLAAG